MNPFPLETFFCGVHFRSNLAQCLARQCSPSECSVDGWMMLGRGKKEGFLETVELSLPVCQGQGKHSGRRFHLAQWYSYIKKQLLIDSG